MVGPIIEANSSDTLRKVRRFVKKLPPQDYAKCSYLTSRIEKITGLADDELPIERVCLALDTGNEVIDWLKSNIQWDQPKGKWFPTKQVRKDKKRIKQIKQYMKDQHDSLLFFGDDDAELGAKPLTNRELLIDLNVDSNAFIY